jgi:hypothetical protein
MTIKHIVIAGGGPTGFYTYGAAKFLYEKKFEVIFWLILKIYSKSSRCSSLDSIRNKFS